MTNYIRHGNRYQVTPNGALDIAELLPLGTYKVGWIEMADEYFLEKIDDFAEPVGKVYGDALAKRDRILRTFDSRPNATGILLTGEKGSGKTMLAKLLSLEAQEKGIPTIVINQPWRGDTFNAFMQSIEQPAVVVFDEFEKVYEKKDQEKLLTLLDGVYASKKLFILTSNDRFQINEHMINRPGRIFYRLNYRGLDNDFIREYATDILDNKERVEEVVRVSMLFARFNFDVLKALVEEMNRYDESAEDALVMLNAKPELGEKLTYVVSLTVDGKPVPEKRIYDRGEWRGNPLTDDVHIHWYPPAKPEEVQTEAIPASGMAALLQAPNPWDSADDDRDELQLLRFRPADLQRVDAATGYFIFENAQGITATLREKVSSAHDYSVVY